MFQNSLAIISVTLDIGLLGYIGTVQHKEHSSEVLSNPHGTPCILFHLFVFVFGSSVHYMYIHVYIISFICVFVFGSSVHYIYIYK